MSSGVRAQEQGRDRATRSAREIHAEITRIVAAVMAPGQGSFEILERRVDVAATVASVTKQLVMNAVSIPEIAVDATDVNFEFRASRNNAIAAWIPLPIFTFP
jgi:hypothetical protein